MGYSVLTGVTHVLSVSLPPPPPISPSRTDHGGPPGPA
jgi:hypothetical protein